MDFRRGVRKVLSGCLISAAALGLAAGAAVAKQITVTHWGAAFYGAPYAVALEKGWFTGPCDGIDGFLTSSGGGTSVRNTLASDLPYGEVALPAAVEAIRSGQPLIIVNSGVGTVADIVWIAKKDSPLGSIQDLKGKKVAYTRPKSVTNMLILMALDAAGIKSDEVELVAAGGMGANFTAAMEGAVDAAMTGEPIWTREQDKLKPVFFVKDVMSPNMTQTVGITTKEFAEKNPELISCIIEARKKGVDFIYANPDDAADIVAKQYQMEPKLIRGVFKTFLDIKYWGRGEFDLEAMDQMVEGLRIVGELEGPMDWSGIITKDYLPEDLKSKM